MTGILPPPAKRTFSLVGKLSRRLYDGIRHDGTPSCAGVTAGFSLVELSIVLVILGLLTGGILTGQNLIRAAELRSVSTEFQTYQTAVHTFRDKYFALPGDMRNATDFWGASTVCPGTSSQGNTDGKTCNGDGNGQVYNTISPYGSEPFRFWQQLSNAGLIEGSYNGVTGSGGAVHAVGGTNVPKGKFSGSLWFTNYQNALNGSPYGFNYGASHILTIGTQNPSSWPSQIFTPEEQWNIDTKLDDGMPAQGKVAVRNRVDCTVKADGTAITSGAADASLFDAKYNLSNTNVVCGPLFRDAY